MGVPRAADSPVLQQRSSCTGSRASLNKCCPSPVIPTQAGATAKGGAQFPLPSESYLQGRASCCRRASLGPEGWLGAQAKYLYPRHAVCGVKKLFHVLGHGCCIHPCHCPSGMGLLPLLPAHSKHQSPWILHCGGAAQAARSRDMRLLCHPLDGSLGLHRLWKGIFIPQCVFCFCLEYPGEKLQIIGREGAFLKDWGLTLQEEQPQHRLQAGRSFCPLCQVMFWRWIG